MGVYSFFPIQFFANDSTLLFQLSFGKDTQKDNCNPNVRSSNRCEEPHNQSAGYEAPEPALAEYPDTNSDTDHPRQPWQGLRDERPSRARCNKEGETQDTQCEAAAKIKERQRHKQHSLQTALVFHPGLSRFWFNWGTGIYHHARRLETTWNNRLLRSARKDIVLHGTSTLLVLAIQFFANDPALLTFRDILPPHPEDGGGQNKPKKRRRFEDKNRNCE